jgi:DNA-binding CsgD family transcriptional regulator
MITEPQSQVDASVAPASDPKPDSALDGTMPEVFGTYTPTIIALVIAISIGSDLVSDLEEHRSTAHMIGMWLGTGLSLVALVVMWRLMRASRAQARSLRVALSSTRTDLMTWRARTSDILHGLGVLIDKQFQDWSLSPAEREIALLLLKGLPFKAIAEARDTSERTVRQQSLAIYRKAGVAGRAELSAFFFEDMLLPKEPRAAEPPRARTADARRT